MKAMLIIIVVMNNYYGNRLQTIQIPMSSYEHCTDIADPTGAIIAADLGEYAVSVSTECVNQGE